MAIMIAMCVFISSFCAVMLVRGSGNRKSRQALCIALCFACFAAENVFLFVDLVIFPRVDLSALRNLAAIAAVICLALGFFERAPQQ